MKISEILIEGQIGPHENKELELMLAGQKPAAFVGSITAFKPYIKDKKISLVGKGLGFAGASVYYVTLPGEEWRGRQLINVVSKLKKLPFGSPETKPYHAKMGLLLGYSKEDIKHFLQTRFK